MKKESNTAIAVLISAVVIVVAASHGIAFWEQWSASTTHLNHEPTTVENYEFKLERSVS